MAVMSFLASSMWMPAASSVGISIVSLTLMGMGRKLEEGLGVVQTTSKL